MVILTGGGEFLGVATEVGRQLPKILAGVLGRMPLFDLLLQIFEALNRGGLDGFDQLEPDADWKEVVVVQFLFYLVTEVRLKRCQ